MSAETPGPPGRAVLVTGCSSGIGRQIALTLSGRGFLVLATVRKEADEAGLRALGLPGLVPVRPLDLANLDHIAAAGRTVAAELERRGFDGLFGLVHNAGGGRPAPVELMDLDGFRTEILARLLGSTALTQAVLPLLRRAAGRIVWIMTPAMIPTPYVASIHACDFGVNCLARTLDVELKAWRIPNVMIRCGGIRTPAGLRTTSDVETLLRDGPSDRVPLYAEALRRWAEAMAAFDAKRTDPARVAEVVFKALSAPRPRRSYSVGHLARAAAFLERLPPSLADRILKSRF